MFTHSILLSSFDLTSISEITKFMHVGRRVVSMELSFLAEQPWRHRVAQSVGDA